MDSFSNIPVLVLYVGITRDLPECDRTAFKEVFDFIYEQGHMDGYAKGHDDGYARGYIDGTCSEIERNTADA